MKINFNTVAKGAFLCFLLIATAHVGHSQMTLAKTEAKVAIIEFEVETLDYGKVAKNSDGTRTISFTNSGDAPLVISDVKSSCGCTVPTYSKAPILPNNTGEITVKYDTAKVGAFTKKITILSNATEASKIIRIKGEVVN